MYKILIRSLLFWALFVALFYGVGHLAAMVPGQWSRLVLAFLGVMAGFFLMWTFLKIEKKTFKGVGLVLESSTLPKFLLGILIGAVFIALALFALTCFTDLELKRSSNAIQLQTWLWSLMVIIPLAFLEELMFRSYAFLQLNKAYGLLWAQFIAAIAFALYHVAGGWSWQVAFLGPGVWAFVFGLAAVWSKGIALPTGIHTALNFLQLLTGMKKDKASLWLLDLKTDHAINAQAQVSKIGIFIQVFILIAALFATWLYIRRSRHPLQEHKPVLPV
ncbi:CAAX protease self-immunity [Chitinophaga rupis]|uniref:CAAX protease self-immunity n=1 Tax=Chitinophaga rupis TaxID=573321 RepID=A0A1H8A258_9BACT|nr:CPBP family intramembrane glutamic endopeptidase [Chitinophaga rupis]SEM63928.1 CAAX protease self-immunity [Chitinophaga rupis]